MNLFTVYRGEFLEVDELTHGALKRLFPEVDLPSSYRDADAWIMQAAKSKRPKDYRKFIINWLRRAKKFDAGKVTVYQDGVRMRVRPGDEVIVDGARCRRTSATR